MITRICKQFTFSAAHYLGNDNLSSQEQKTLFGKCCGIREGEDKCFPHGHTYKLEVTVEGEVYGKTGMLINFTDLKKIVNAYVLDLYDHKCLNWEVPPYTTGVIPTAENMAAHIFDLLKNKLKANGVKLVSIKIWEGPESCAEVISD